MWIPNLNALNELNLFVNQNKTLDDNQKKENLTVKINNNIF
jgi:hypothetical protein